MALLIALVRRELTALWRDPWQLALISYIPLIGMLCLWWLFSAGLPRQLPVAIVDQDHSQLSRMLTRQLKANPVTELQNFTDLAAAVSAMQQAKVYAIVVFPYDMKKDLLTGHKPTIDVRYNSQFLLVGKLLSSQIQLSLGDGLLQIAGLKQLANGTPKSQVAVNLSPVKSQTTALFNRNNNYIGFLVPPVLIALWQLLSMLVMANSLNRELHLAPTTQVNGIANTLTEHFWPKVLAKVVLFTPILMLQGGFILTWLYLYLALPMAGSLALLLVAQLVMLLAVWSLVLFIFVVMRDSARVISFCTALFAPAFAFMGITFPTHDMPQLAQWWRLIMPSSHYIESHVSVVSYGATWPSVAGQLSSYWGFICLLPLIYLLSRQLLPITVSANNVVAVVDSNAALPAKGQ
ncbi:ABC transporter permease [Shewanella sp. CG12_big_fil_rev_8_21_14_0_65_47_15]|uniref:ABC transporter permease n=1 Tax=Shewanella sp. CG12_big_fil_rev_8_21_14_0_65_47_15 TaxID=1975537 RepID=UPI000CB13768|nr:ABC transporter permease [Shewanella sp. CG12_big_fil_rev_8_21_14_0_65_47_15]PIW59968.1 MAG: ABC transporter permease [Shewanella sp. CG12_big_fil_rev_8_21_14_0_65_47_15]